MKSILGDMKNRVRTDVRMPKDMAARVEHLCQVMGIQKNAFLTLAVGHLIAVMAPLFPGQKRKTILDRVEKAFLDIMKQARKSA